MKKLLFAILLGALFVSCSKVPAGNVGIKFYLLGKDKGVDYEVLGPGRYWIGINEELFLFPTQRQNKVWSDDEEGNRGFDGYVCGCGMYIECGGKVIYQHTLPTKLCRNVANLVYECNMTPMYEHSKSFYCDKRSRNLDGFVKLKRRFEMQGKDLSPDVSDNDFAFDKFLAWYDEKSDIERFKREIEKDFDFIVRGDGFCEMTVKGFSKGTGIEKVLEYHNIPINSAYAIGDSMNDLPMLNAVPNSIVMGNGSDELKKSASFVTKDLLDNGIEYALKHFGMI